ncbi:hypothetical protein LIER_40281 [Lithospermum erythrorhizon]|uniref:Transmembrane protein n=1 Tax=Lithospermum erythrorhizon TaxID=34254 RepID=A0AAV3QTB1_LITER
MEKWVLGVVKVSHLPTIRPPFALTPLHSFNFSPLPLKKSRTTKRTTFTTYAAEKQNNDDGKDKANGSSNMKNDKASNGNGEKNNGKDGKGNGRLRLNLRWVDLFLDPDPDNIVAVGLTGLLTWASVSVLWQLFVISLAILLAALKYSLVAALLILILIALL